MRTVILYTVSGLLLVIAILVAIDWYVLSLPGTLFRAVGLCDHKSVTVRGINSHAVKLSFPLDPKAVAAEMRKNPNYYVGDPNVYISRRFGNVEYNVFLQSLDGSGYFNINTHDSESWRRKREPVWGERCTTPNRVLINNINTIIDDLPLPDAQKKEMKSHVHATMKTDLQLFPIL